ncbi:hypothetical protein I5677_03690 [Mobilitalea sibirica]|uniref:Bacterial Pleckstrin homology domain-containing protein n=1 Tax=Mobilitalea sibirica TaxID=1462919 RepID=A0A8J7L255_9FIRM|nr:hypothetical protein [Mobilitalea sibirica]MBH1939998.1 hypothetical protein [Mobilitalea sibirica]
MNQSSRKLFSYILGAIILVGVTIFLVVLYNSTKKETEIVISDEYFEVQGMFGATYYFDDIEVIELRDTIPKITRKNNGSGLGEVKKGDFEVEGLGSGKLFILSKEGPYIYVQTKDSYVIINYKDQTKTKELYESLTTYLD